MSNLNLINEFKILWKKRNNKKLKNTNRVLLKIIINSLRKNKLNTGEEKYKLSQESIMFWKELQKEIHNVSYADIRELKKVTQKIFNI